MNYYAGIDVSLEASSVCVIDTSGKIVREAKVASEPEALIAWLGSLGLELTRIGLEARPLSQWLYAGMREAGLVVELLETRHVRNAFKIMPVKADRKDAHGIAELMRLGWMCSGTVERSTAAPDSSATTSIACCTAAGGVSSRASGQRRSTRPRSGAWAACRPRRSKVSRNPRPDGHGHLCGASAQPRAASGPRSLLSRSN
jgi:hypothetical protein